LNATLWLNSQFREPPLNDTIDTFQEELKITVSDTNSTVQEYSDLKLARLLDPSIVPTLEENTSMLSGIQADRISYTAKTRQNELKLIEIWTTNAGKAYDITFSSLASTYDQYLPIVENMIKTFEIAPLSLSSDGSYAKQTNSTVAEVFVSYVRSGIRIDHPSDWEVLEQNNNNNNNNSSNASTSVIFRSPFEDSKSDLPSWREITFTMAIDIDSVHDAGTDYRVIYSRIPHGTWTGYWTR
jgi:hypothetical protein